MKRMAVLLPFIALTLLSARSKMRKEEQIKENTKSSPDTGKIRAGFASYFPADNVLSKPVYTLKDINLVTGENRAAAFSLGISKEGRKIPAFYFPGISEQRALVIAGVHGSELSAIEVAWQLYDQLLNGDRPYYSVVTVPSLFPDNAIKALNDSLQIGSTANIGRYTLPSSVDPNRQMPSPGKAYDETRGKDHLGRDIEKENQYLLQLIQAFRPQRIVSVHAIRDMNYGGVYADPRTDQDGIALGYSSDKNLAVAIAAYIYRRGGNVAGNNLDKEATTLYYKDPPPVGAGSWQKRNMAGSALNANRGSGVSLGTWASTGIANEKDPSRNREAIRIITIEYPGYKRPADYAIPSQQLSQQKQVGLFASAIRNIFLGRYFLENETSDFARNNHFNNQ